MKAAGKLSVLEDELNDNMPQGTIGIGHTRWATHGAPTTTNAHPHTDQSGRIAVIHNGIIENSGAIRKALEQRGHTFKSETDTEVLAHLVGEFYRRQPGRGRRHCAADVDGAYGLAFISSDEPGVLVAARKGSPLLVGVGENEWFVASDASPLLQHTRSVVYLDDGEMVVLTRDGYRVRNLETARISKPVNQIDWDLATVERGGYAHFMLKEICEQPESLLQHAARPPAGGRGHRPRQRPQPDRRGAQAVRARHHHRLRHLLALRASSASTCWKRWRGSRSRSSTPPSSATATRSWTRRRWSSASPSRARPPTRWPPSAKPSAAAPAPSGWSTWWARPSRAKWTAASTCTPAPRSGVASTKAFTSQVAALALITLRIARLRNLSILQGRQFIHALQRLPEQVGQILERSSEIEQLADRFLRTTQNALYLGRGVNFPVALEGALKLKEISYIHAEGYPAAEMKHGPIALIDENMPVVFIAPRDAVHSKIVSNIEEVKARGGKVIALINEGDAEIERLADATFTIPETLDLLTPILTSIPLQLLSYYVAVSRGCNVDQPRNLAKSVTVE